MANSTAETIIGLARNLLRTESTSDVPVIQNSFMLQALTDGNAEWKRAHQRGSGNAPLVFSRDKGFDVVSETALAEDVTTSTTDFDVDDGSNLEASGVVAVWDQNMSDVVSYSGISSNNLTGVTGIGFSHEDGDEVQKLYALPSNFGKLRKAEGYGDGVRLNGSGLFFRDAPPKGKYFTLHDDGTTVYLWLPRNVTGDVSVLYDKKSAAIDSMDDTVDVPVDYQLFLVWRLVEFGFVGRSDEVQNMDRAERKGNKILNEALKERNIGSFVRVRPIRTRHGRYYDPSLTRQDV